MSALMQICPKVYLWHIYDKNIPLIFLVYLWYGIYIWHIYYRNNTTSTIQYKYAARQKQAFEFGCADGQGPASRRGSHVYEINDWMWPGTLELEDFQWPRRKRSVESPGLRHPGALGRPGRPAKWRIWYVYTWYTPGIYLSDIHAE